MTAEKLSLRGEGQAGGGAMLVVVGSGWSWLGGMALQATPRPPSLGHAHGRSCMEGLSWVVLQVTPGLAQSLLVPNPAPQGPHLVITGRPLKNTLALTNNCGTQTARVKGAGLGPEASSCGTITNFKPKPLRNARRRWPRPAAAAWIAPVGNVTVDHARTPSSSSTDVAC